VFVGRGIRCATPTRPILAVVVDDGGQRNCLVRHFAGMVMKRLTVAFPFLVFLFLRAQVCAQSPFDGTWLIKSDTGKLPEKPQVLLLDKGMFCCMLEQKVKADGQEHQLPASASADTAKIQVASAHSVEVVVKKDGKEMFTTTYMVSDDGNTLTEEFRDTTEKETVITEVLYHRLEKGTAGAHEISGSWRAHKSKKSQNGSIIKYKCTAEGFSAETPLGEKYYGKFDGKFYPTEDDPYHTLASAKLIDRNTVELTQKRGETIISVLRLTVSADGKSIHAVFESKLNNTSSSFEMEKQP